MGALNRMGRSVISCSLLVVSVCRFGLLAPVEIFRSVHLLLSVSLPSCAPLRASDSPDPSLSSSHDIDGTSPRSSEPFWQPQDAPTWAKHPLDRDSLGSILRLDQTAVDQLRQSVSVYHSRLAHKASGTSDTRPNEPRGTLGVGRCRTWCRTLRKCRTEVKRCRTKCEGLKNSGVAMRSQSAAVVHGRDGGLRFLS